MASQDASKIDIAVSESTADLHVADTIELTSKRAGSPVFTHRRADQPLAANAAFATFLGRDTFWKVTTCFACCWALVFAIAVAGLAVAVQSWRPEVLLTGEPAAPFGYYYGGATYQGSGNWVTNKPVLPTARSDLSAVSVPEMNLIYLLGGMDGTDTVLDDTLIFDPIFEQYNTSAAKMPTPLYRMGTAAWNKVVYVAGGVILKDGPPTASVHAYNAPANSWTTLANMSIARSDLALAAFNSKLYAIGGYGVDYVMTVSGSLVEEYDIATNTWTVKASMPTPRGDLAAVAFGSRIFVMGGWNDVSEDFQPTTEGYDPVTNTWAQFANMLVPKGDMAFAVYRGKVFSIGGEVWSGLTGPCPWDPTQQCGLNQVPTHDMLSFNPATAPASRAQYGGVNSPGGLAPLNDKPGVWVPRSPMPGARFRFAAAANEVAQAVFVFGGTMQNSHVVDSVSAFYDTEHADVFMHYKM